MQTITIPTRRPVTLWVTAAVALVFDARTLKEGGAVLLTGGVVCRWCGA